MAGPNQPLDTPYWAGYTDDTRESARPELGGNKAAATVERAGWRDGRKDKRIASISGTLLPADPFTKNPSADEGVE
jgi:hypothetical protein